MSDESLELVRILEPEVMDSDEEALTYDQMDHGDVNQAFVADWWQALGPNREDWTGELLDVGTGTARIPILLCRQAPGIRILAIDMSNAMLRTARINLELDGCLDRVRLDLLDAKQLDLADERFAGVVSNSLIHHLPDPATAVREMWRVTRPGGQIFVRDLCRPANRGVLAELVQQVAGNESPAAQTMFRESLHAALTLSEIQAMVRDVGGDPQQVMLTSNRHWTWSQTKPG